MAKINLYSTKSKTVSKLDLPKDFLGDINMALLAQAVHVYRDRTHRGTSKVKTRGDVSLTTAKWYRQKGTGNARHGAKSAPIFVGGGVTHGPKGIKRVLTLSRKMRQKALVSAFSYKNKKSDLVAVDGMATLKKTKDASLLVERIRDGEKARRSAKLVIFTSDKSGNASGLFRNIKTVRVMPFSNANAYETHKAGKVILDAEIFSKGKEKKTK